MSTLMVSVSGIRGIIGDGLYPGTIVKYTSAFADFCGDGKIVIGSDGRFSGAMVKNIIVGSLLAKGCDVVDIGICPTPTVLYNVKKINAAGGISISASHNPNEWNALKLVNNKGEFLTTEQNEKLQSLISSASIKYAAWNKLGIENNYPEGLDEHVEAVLNLSLVNLEAIRERKFKVVLDSVNGAGAYVLPKLLEFLGCEVITINCDKSGIFPRRPEPVPENLTETLELVKNSKVDLGIVVDPDVDRLVLITEKGEPFIEENTIAQIVKFILSKTPGSVAVNLSTTRAVDDIAKDFGCEVFRSPVGEANVVKIMKDHNAVIGGEGSGGVIYPELHYARDALVGIVLTLQHLIEFGGTMSELKDSLPQYSIVKKKIEIENKNPDKLINAIHEKYAGQKINKEDGLRIDFDDHWVHLRKSNTEPIIRCIVEAGSKELANDLADKYFDELKNL